MWLGGDLWIFTTRPENISLTVEIERFLPSYTIYYIISEWILIQNFYQGRIRGKVYTSKGLKWGAFVHVFQRYTCALFSAAWQRYMFLNKLYFKCHSKRKRCFVHGLFCEPNFLFQWIKWSVYVRSLDFTKRFFFVYTSCYIPVSGSLNKMKRVPLEYLMSFRED